jgi:methylase of polypeptide subunit release factors
MTADIRIEDALGVCGVREDTQLLAETAYAALFGSCTPCRALDLGAGSGYVGIYLALRGWQVDAVDVSPRALALARRNAELNGVAPRIYQSNLFSDVRGQFDVIACNPPMRADETEGSRFVTATLRRAGLRANALMRMTQPVLERKRIDFLAEIARGARSHLVPDGRLLLVISPLEQAELPACVPGLALEESRTVPGIPGLAVAVFSYAVDRFDGARPTGAHVRYPHPKEAPAVPQRPARKAQKDGTH